LLSWTGLTRTPDELFSSSQEQGRVRAVLASLPERQAELLLLRHDGASYGELASSLDMNPASVGTLLSRAQQAFRKEYVNRYGEPHE
jgi:RNA polymerase sigma-70 factor (ECF subfamily)